MQIQNLASITQKYPTFPTALLPDSSLALLEDNFILYSTQLNLSALTQFQQKCGQNFQCFDAWNVAKNTIVLLKGKWQDTFLAIAHGLGLDIAPLNFKAKLSEKGLLVMDMDSTAIQIECIDEIAKLAGTGELVSAITESAMRGELDFEQSLRRRVSTLKDAPESILQEVRSNLPLMPGLQETLQTLQEHGWKTAIASGGFTYFADYLKDLLKLDCAVSNQFDIVDGKLTGLVKGDVVDAQYKAHTLQRLRDEYHIEPENTIAIGDGANDLAMMNVAGLGVAFHAKPKVQQQAQIVVNFADLTALLCLLSARERI
ncbi:phosphoserine phosphatase [Rodentibacter pneumotropicus]|uniref:phosphoserine phosphatase n=1 Tax=Rodentibacter pneumotropicus TaxID=758 RepID=UPI00036C631A|nr:phosphoserine phosphatase [Rodentibacter pneumotropicus]NBH74420.1 phosphoserine phosphatase [Rodentibacter pneumotropicus]OOF64005.1 phosphoserine phosphatase SerB [Rodentibacter pneumotropicus]THA03835.1 phosphoserine phosphatase [Rodentibacter pneumotropicus]THA04382.1 phosphoserine phosphatase [Rodentibacter pneumotropicus]THA11972.1 phosphoserine phosphatase [Rodentibacter pneumotropicus]